MLTSEKDAAELGASLTRNANSSASFRARIGTPSGGIRRHHDILSVATNYQGVRPRAVRELNASLRNCCRRLPGERKRYVACRNGHAKTCFCWTPGLVGRGEVYCHRDWNTQMSRNKLIVGLSALAFTACPAFAQTAPPKAPSSRDHRASGPERGSA